MRTSGRKLIEVIHASQEANSSDGGHLWSVRLLPFAAAAGSSDTCCRTKIKSGCLRDQDCPLTCVELRGFELLTPSMPWRLHLWLDVAHNS